MSFILEKLGCSSECIESTNEDVRPKTITFVQQNIEVPTSPARSSCSEAYSITSNTDNLTITIAASDTAGAFYGTQTLISILDNKKSLNVKECVNLPEFTIRDAPRYPYRGMHVDVSRNFHGKASILKLLDVMSMYKMNKFHFHLTDDEGWRIEIPGLPELTEVRDEEHLTCVISNRGTWG